MKTVLQGLSLMGIFGLSLKLAQLHERNTHRPHSPHSEENYELEDLILVHAELPDFPITATQYRVLKPASKDLMDRLSQIFWSPNIHHHKTEEDIKHSHHHLSKKEKVTREIEEFVSFKH